MSSQRGNCKKTAQKHQNTHSFSHNSKSKKSERIMNFQSDGVCHKCKENLEWRKKYRKYKPLTAPKICLTCKKRTITKAYRTRCNDCALKEKVCAKCGDQEMSIPIALTTEEQKKEEAELEARIKGMSERERRTYYRKLDRGDFDEKDNDMKIKNVNENQENETEEEQCEETCSYHEQEIENENKEDKEDKENEVVINKLESDEHDNSTIDKEMGKLS
eukprot:Pgem_evm1s19443